MALLLGSATISRSNLAAPNLGVVVGTSNNDHQDNCKDTLMYNTAKLNYTIQHIRP